MSRHLHIDPLGGVAGDMWLGLLIDLGLEIEELEALVDRLELEEVSLRVEAVRRGAFAATKVHVVVGGWEEPPGEHSAPPPVSGPHRHLREMLALVERAALGERATERARRTLEALYRAEARVHGMPLEEVHLHEAGADDALVDILGTCLGLDRLDIATVTCTTPLRVGGGRIRCAHGLLPVPVPAVTVLLEGVEIEGGPIDKELITPTGAALLRAVVDDFGPLPGLRIEASGHGAGGRDDPGLANVLRGVLGTACDGSAPRHRRVGVVTTALDDISPQDLPPLTETLRAAGALDVWTQPLAMKKGRPGFLLTVITPAGEGRRLAEVLLRASPSLGVRVREEERLEWARDTIPVETPWGTVRIKRAIDGAGHVLRGVPEFEDCLAAARAASVSVDRVRRAAHRAFEDRGPADPTRKEDEA
ncbi:MAG TPA: nickel pincer cofactor biosynthesis protein LarC [Acidobacteria bacterium]|nr:nickel pincer cofactor biosynthesis protein LarC [Acidobacteriota bacterium]